VRPHRRGAGWAGRLPRLAARFSKPG